MRIIENIAIKFQNTQLFNNIKTKHEFESFISRNYINIVGDYCLIKYHNKFNSNSFDISPITDRLFNFINNTVNHDFPKSYNKFKSIKNVLITYAEINDIDRILEFIDITLDYWFYDWNTKEDTSWMVNNVDKVMIAYEFKNQLNNICKYLSEYHTIEEIKNYINSI